MACLAPMDGELSMTKRRSILSSTVAGTGNTEPHLSFGPLSKKGVDEPAAKDPPFTPAQAENVPRPQQSKPLSTTIGHRGSQQHASSQVVHRRIQAKAAYLRGQIANAIDRRVLPVRTRAKGRLTLRPPASPSAAGAVTSSRHAYAVAVGRHGEHLNEHPHAHDDEGNNEPAREERDEKLGES